MKEIEIKTPLEPQIISKLEIGNIVQITGSIYTLKDATHKKLIEDFNSKKKLPFDFKNQVIYYASPSPSPRGNEIGACGPTTSARMEVYLPFLLSKGIKAIIGKGPLSKESLSLLNKNNALYLIATGGAGAFLSKFIKKAEIVAYKDLGPQAIYKLTVEKFPCIVASAKGKYLLKE